MEPFSYFREIRVWFVEIYSLGIYVLTKTCCQRLKHVKLISVIFDLGDNNNNDIKKTDQIGTTYGSLDSITLNPYNKTTRVFRV